MSDHDHHHDQHGAESRHDHGGSGHSHAPNHFGKAFATGIILNAGFVVLEIVFGLLGHSVALLADAGHNLSDVLGLLVAWGASLLIKRAPSRRFTYGLAGTSILAALFNAVFLLVVVGGLSGEAVGRLFHPEPVAGGTVTVVAAAGILINGACAWLFASGRQDDLNIRGAFAHMAADALVSLGVVFAGCVTLLSGWFWIDPVVSLVINAIIIWATWSLLRDSLALSLCAVPPGIDATKVDAFLVGQPGVEAIHDLHIWGMSTTETALTAHLVMPDGHPGDAFLMDLRETLKARFRIGHATIQVEIDPGNPCARAPAHVIPYTSGP